MRESSRRLIALIREELRLEGDIPLHSPEFKGREWEYLKECLDSGWVSSAGPDIARFEEAMATKLSARFALAAVNGTAALHLTLHAIGVRPGDLVICPSLTFVATANAIAHAGATPLFADIEPRRLGLDPARLAEFLRANGPRFQGKRIAACLPVHVFGIPADMDGLAKVCAAHGVPVVEDASEALGSNYRGRACGTLARAGVFSFNGNKIMTTGGGGMVVTDDESLAKRLRHLATTARLPHPWLFDHDEVAFNYRMPNLNAALGRAQLERLDDFVARKRRLAALYGQRFADCPGTEFVAEPAGDASNCWFNALRLEDAGARDAFLAETNAARIQTRPCWQPMHRTGAHKGAPRAHDLTETESAFARLVNVPSSAWMVA
jgi:perosamine synthetase